MRNEWFSSHIFQNNTTTLTVYQTKPTENVLLLSSMHHTVSIGNEPKKIPETVQNYNSSKYGIDVLDQMARLYSSKCSSHHWHFQVFYIIFDVTVINSHLMYK